MKRKGILAVGLALMILATGCGSKLDRAPLEKAGKEQGLPVGVETLETSEIVESFYSLGAVEPSRTYKMNALTNADVKKVYVSVGDIVSAGDLLFELETDDFKTNKTSQLSNVKTQLDTSKIQLDSASKNYEDTKALYNQGAVSKSALDQAEDAYESAKLNYNSALTGYNTTLSSLSSTEENYLVTSPVDGIVTSRSVEESQFATTQNGVTVAQYNPIKVSLNIPSTQIDKAYKGQPVRIVFPSQDLEMTAKLTAINLAGSAGGYPAEVEIVNTESKLLPGMTAEVYLETAKSEAAFVTEKNTVLEDESGYYIYLVKDGKAVKVPVEKGIEDGEHVQIIGALSIGDQVVVKGHHYLKENDLVLVK
ncbi:efflux RND transporter periplasmic adaptor subunit [Fusibacter sp. JL216-2]|uniref:efflux RND transporter periplasmic adaptor subunit n=1 Tax=Fusibacter sp. JL216-2 TaxID=3071453 RepID=UPI003D356EE7